MMFKNITKKILTGMLALSLVVGGVVIVPSQAKAAGNRTTVKEVVDEKETGVVWVEYTNADYTALKGKVPSYEGTVEGQFIFGGWYKSTVAALDEASKANSGAISEGETVNNATVYARFVPSHVLSMKAQNRYNKDGIETKADMRLVSAVDCLDYSALGFEVKINNKKELSTDTTTKVFSSLRIRKSASEYKDYTAADLFGSAAKYTFTWALTGIAKANYEKIIYARPYWVTKDGTKVYGLAKYAHIQDSIDGIINIPISIYEAKQVAAGVLTVDYPEDKIEYIDMEKSSRMFAEADVNPTKGKIKCVGNVANIESNAMTDTDLYINLRFRAISAQTYAGAGNGEILNFTVNGEDFCNIAEESVPVDAWNVQY